MQVQLAQDLDGPGARRIQQQLVELARQRIGDAEIGLDEFGIGDAVMRSERRGDVGVDELVGDVLEGEDRLLVSSHNTMEIHIRLLSIWQNWPKKMV